MALKLDDLLSKKKEVVQVLDLSKSIVTSDDEYRRLMEKVPEFKTKPEKVKPEDIKIQDQEGKWKRKRGRRSVKQYQFADPMPLEMRSIELDDICSVNIQWNMLTDLRPKTKLDEEYFSRLVELGKLRIQMNEKEGKTPDTDFLRKMKNKSGVEESRYLSCGECGEEFCLKETCCLFQYDSFKRETPIEVLGKVDKSKERILTKRRKSKNPKIRRKKGGLRDHSKPRSKGKSKRKGGTSGPKPKASKGKRKKPTVNGSKIQKGKPLKRKQKRKRVKKANKEPEN